MVRVLTNKSLIIATASIVTSLMLFSQATTFAAVSAVNWYGPNGSVSFSQNSIPQNVINTNNVQNLQVEWLFPVPAAPPPYVGSEGSLTTPSVVNGVVYFLTEYHILYALDARNGRIIWQKSLGGLTWYGKNMTAGHYHALWFSQQIRGHSLVWLLANNMTLYGWNALTGDREVKFVVFDPKTVSGNFGYYDVGGGHNMAIDEKRGIIVVGSEGSEGVNAARGFFEGIDVASNPPKMLWRSFFIPPQDGSDPNWAINSVASMSHAYIWNGKTRTAVDLKSLSATQLHDMLYADWGTFGFNGTHSWAGANGGWGGSWSVDPRTGVAYVATAQPGPDYNATTRPGPNLWSASILAVDVTTGKFVWAFQSTPHDMYDFDCAWNVSLANATINGAMHTAVIKGCKNGFVYALDAGTGAPLWNYFSPSITPAKGGMFLWPDPTNSTQMKLPYPTYPNGPTTIVYDMTGTGNIESDLAYDPTTNYVFSVSYNIPTKGTVTATTGKSVKWDSNNIGIVGSFGGFGKYGSPDNCTVTAIDANTGKAAWTYFIPVVPFRGGVTVSGGVVFVPSMDGLLRMFDAKTGKLITEKLIGAGMIIQPSLGTDSNGDMKLFQLTGGWFGTPIGPTSFPGDLIALGVPAAQPVQTETTTQVTTHVTTQVVTSTAVSSVTTASGVDPTTFYAAVGVAVIFVIATGILAIRRRRPAS